MTKILCVIMFITLSAVTGCSQEQTEKPESTTGPMKKIVAVGDSLTAGYGLDESAGYPALLEKKLQADGYNYQVVNAGVSGETSSGALSRMEWILTLDPDIVILETGANDGLRGIEPQLTEKNIRRILQLLKEKNVVTLLTGMKMVANLGLAYVNRFDAVYPELAEEFDVLFMPFFLEGVAMKRTMTLSDGIHPNAEGYKIIAENIYPYVLQAIDKRAKQ